MDLKMTATYSDLKSSIRATGRFDLRLIMVLAAQKARQERDAYARLNIRRSYGKVLSDELRIVWQVAKTAMDGLATDRMIAAASPAERAARGFELRAEMAETSIPPCAERAAYLREVLWPGLVPYFVAALFTVPVTHLVAHHGRIAGAGILLGTGVLYTILLAIVMDWLILHPAEREQWRNLLQRGLRKQPAA